MTKTCINLDLFFFTYRQYVDKYINDMNMMKNRLLERRKTLKEKVDMENAANQKDAYNAPSSSNYGQK